MHALWENDEIASTRVHTAKLNLIKNKPLATLANAYLCPIEWE
jgi:hypothetical protein